MGTVIRPQAEEESFTKLAMLLGVARENLCNSERRLIRQDVMITPNTTGKDEEHLVILCNDVVVIAEQARIRKNDSQQFEVRHCISIKGIKANRHINSVYLEHQKEDVNVVLEAEPAIINVFYSALSAEIEVQNSIRELPRSVVRPSRDPRDRMPQGIVRPLPRRAQPVEVIYTTENLRALRRSAMAEIMPADSTDGIQEDTNDDERPLSLHITEIEGEGGAIVEIKDQDYEVDDDETRNNFNYRLGLRIARFIYGEHQAAGILTKRQLQFPGKCIMMDDTYTREVYRFIVFLDVCVLQKVNDKRYEHFLMSECEFEEQKTFITLRWPHKFFMMDLEPSTGQRWSNKFKEAIALSKEHYNSLSEEQRCKPIVVANCVVRSGKTCISRPAPETCPIGPSEEEQKNAHTLLQIQTSLGVTCDWLMARRRRYVLQGSLMAYAENGELETRRVILLSDRILITKPTEFKTHPNHTHDIIDDLELLNTKVNGEDTLVHIHTRNQRKFLMADTPQRAQQWTEELSRQCALITLIAQRLREGGASMALLEEALEMENAPREINHRSIVVGPQGRFSVYPVQDGLPDADEADDEASVRTASPTGSYRGNASDNEDMVMHANSPVEGRMNDFDDDTSLDEEEIDEDDLRLQELDAEIHLNQMDDISSDSESDEEETEEDRMRVAQKTIQRLLYRDLQQSALSGLENRAKRRASAGFCVPQKKRALRLTFKSRALTEDEALNMQVEEMEAALAGDADPMIESAAGAEEGEEEEERVALKDPRLVKDRDRMAKLQRLEAKKKELALSALVELANQPVEGAGETVKSNSKKWKEYKQANGKWQNKEEPLTGAEAPEEEAQSEEKVPEETDSPKKSVNEDE